MDEVVNTLLDDHALIALLGDNIDSIVEPKGDGDAIEMLASVQQPRGPNRLHAP